MIEKIFCKLKNTKNDCKNIQDIINCSDEKEERKLYEKAYEINKKNFDKINYETNMYFPLIYEIEDNCPTCGYRTPQSRRHYNTKYIETIIKYELDQIKHYPISSINCYNKQQGKYNESDVIFKTLDMYDIDKNIKIYAIEDFQLLDKYNFNRIIINPEDKKVYHKITNDPEIIQNRELIIELNIDNKNTAKDMTKINRNIENITSIELRGFDPFIDTIQEYNPQYSKEHLLKIICILKILYPDIELKIQHAKNNNNHYDETLKLGINTITGVYTNKTSKLFNADNILENISSSISRD